MSSKNVPKKRSIWLEQSSEDEVEEPSELELSSEDEIKLSSGDKVESPKKKQLPKRMCLVCDTEKGINQFPSRKRVSSHEHEQNVCRPCYLGHLKTEIDSKNWDEVACPECSITLTYKEVKDMTSTENFAKYTMQDATVPLTLLTDNDIGMSKRASEQLLPQTRTSDTVSPSPANPVNYTQVVRMSPSSAVKNAVTSTALPAKPIGIKTRPVKSFKLSATD
jgi:hypothetical protein